MNTANGVLVESAAEQTNQLIDIILLGGEAVSIATDGCLTAADLANRLAEVRPAACNYSFLDGTRVVSPDENVALLGSELTATASAVRLAFPTNVEVARGGFPGIYFDVENIGACSIEITELHLGLYDCARLSVYARTTPSECAGADTDSDQWSCIGGIDVEEKLRECQVMLHSPLVIATGSTHGLYLHAVPDDVSVAVSTSSPGAAVEDKHLRVKPARLADSATPFSGFDSDSARSKLPCGALLYRAAP